MSTSIEWAQNPDGTPGETWNPTRGCRKISPGCKHCYAETFAERWRGIPGHPYELGFDPRLAPDALDKPLKWKKPRGVFVNSMSDLFLENFSNEYIAAVFGVMAACPQHRFLVLTKRSKRMREWFEWAGSRLDDPWAMCMFEASNQVPQNRPARFQEEAIGPLSGPWPLPNVWLGVSVENQEYAEERIPDLMRTPAAVRFLSCEPLLGPVQLDDLVMNRSAGAEDHISALHCDVGIEDDSEFNGATIDWVIVGGESGNGARPMQLEWARSIVAQCKADGVACFVKQLGSCASDPVNGIAGAALRVPHDAAALISLRLRNRKGGDIEEWPHDLRVREFPLLGET